MVMYLHNTRGCDDGSFSFGLYLINFGLFLSVIRLIYKVEKVVQTKLYTDREKVKKSKEIRP